jgi:hypothetical protein
MVAGGMQLLQMIERLAAGAKSGLTTKIKVLLQLQLQRHPC